MSTKALVKGFEAFTACDVADALLKLQVPHGGFLAGLTMWSPRRQDGPTKIVGPAYTVKYVRKTDEQAPKLAGHYVCTPTTMAARPFDAVLGEIESARKDIKAVEPS